MVEKNSRCRSYSPNLHWLCFYPLINSNRYKVRYIILIAALLLLQPRRAAGYSVLTHEAIIDIAWQPVIVPILKQHYPAATDKDIEDAHAYAYGGAIAPDMGYYPFGNHLFSDLVHYVRNGDFVVTLQREAGNVREYAFALGVLAHYVADRYGHELGVNRAEPLVFPKIRDKYGATVTYEQAPIEHVRTEFGFDVLQTARGNYASDAYHRFISFEVADSLLRRAFERNYDLDIDSVFKNFPRSVRTFRWAVKDIFPQLTKAAWRNKRPEIQQQNQTATARKFHYRMRQREFYTTYGNDVERAGFGAKCIAFLLRIMPKVGPLKALKPVIPNAEAEKLFIRSFDTVSAHYRTALKYLTSGGDNLANINFDTGHPTQAGAYALSDKTYDNLLAELQKKHFSGLSKGLKEHLIDFYSQKTAATGKPIDDEQATREALKELRTTRPIAN